MKTAAEYEESLRKLNLKVYRNKLLRLHQLLRRLFILNQKAPFWGQCAQQKKGLLTRFSCVTKNMHKNLLRQQMLISLNISYLIAHRKKQLHAA